MDPVSPDRAKPLWLEASFPRHRRFVPAVGEMAVRVAAICGCREPEAIEVGREVTGAMDRALSDGTVSDGQFDVAFHADETELDVTVSSGGESLLSLIRPRSD